MPDKRRCIIVGGAPVNNYDHLKSIFSEDDFFIYCDGGLDHLKALGRKADLIVGDFDSHEKPDVEEETIVLPREKDDTDTFFAVKEGIRRGFDDFLIIGAIGKRFDHSLGNISILLYLDKNLKKGCIIDDYSEMELVSDKVSYIEDSYDYFSLLNITGLARGIDIKGAKFPLSDGEISCDYQYGISNEVLPGERAEVSVREGRLLLVKVRDPKL
ncbi:MAG: thiamine diphosphokinase [Lachnospiraceae bacterium]|nr:thiamine diphosphokinase [Lachnospiraceae bacterium]